AAKAPAAWVARRTTSATRRRRIDLLPRVEEQDDQPLVSPQVRRGGHRRGIGRTVGGHQVREELRRPDRGDRFPIASRYGRERLVLNRNSRVLGLSELVHLGHEPHPSARLASRQQKLLGALVGGGVRDARGEIIPSDRALTARVGKIDLRSI